MRLNTLVRSAVGPPSWQACCERGALLSRGAARSNVSRSTSSSIYSSYWACSPHMRRITRPWGDGVRPDF